MRILILFIFYVLFTQDCSCQDQNNSESYKVFTTFKDSLFSQSISNETKSIMIYNSSMDYIYSNMNGELTDIELQIILSTKLSSQYFYFLFKNQFDSFLKELEFSELKAFERNKLIRLLFFLSVDNAHSNNDYLSLAFSLSKESLKIERDTVSQINLFKKDYYIDTYSLDLTNTSRIELCLDYYVQSIANSMTFSELNKLRDEILRKVLQQDNIRLGCIK